MHMDMCTYSAEAITILLARGCRPTHLSPQSREGCSPLCPLDNPFTASPKAMLMTYPHVYFP